MSNAPKRPTIVYIETDLGDYDVIDPDEFEAYADHLEQRVQDRETVVSQTKGAIAAMLSEINLLLGDMPNPEQSPTIVEDCANVIVKVAERIDHLEQRVRELAAQRDKAVDILRDYRFEHDEDMKEDSDGDYDECTCGFCTDMDALIARIDNEATNDHE